MWMYFVLLALISLDFFLENLFNKKNKKATKFEKVLSCVFKYRLITIVSLVLISTLRAYSVGTDLNGYYINYRALKTESFSNLFKQNLRFEMGYTLICFTLAKIGFSFRIVLFLASLFISVCFYKFITKFSPNKFMSFILFVCLGLFAQSLNIVRQIIALGFVLLAICSLFDNKIIKSIILIVCASMFHTTAVLALIFVLIKYLKPTKQLISFVVVAVLVGATVFPYIMKIIEIITPIDYYSTYCVNGIILYIQSTALIDVLYTLALGIIFVLMFVLKKYLILEEKDNKIYDFFLVTYLFVPLIRFAGFMLNLQGLFNRISIYFFFSIIILIPLFIKGVNLKKKWKNFAYCAVYVISFGYMIYFYVFQASNGVVPYLFCF